MSDTKKQTCKISTAQWRYPLDDVDNELRRRYTEEDQSLRDLEKFFNTKLIRTVLRTHNIEYFSGEPENYHRILTQQDDAVSSADVSEVQAMLQSEGVDVDQLMESFVSYQTIGTHLRDCLGIDTKKTSKKQTKEDTRERVGKLKSRLASVLTRDLNYLQDQGEISIGDSTVSVSTRVSCNDCGRVFNLTDLFEEGSCDCETTGDNVELVESEDTPGHPG